MAELELRADRLIPIARLEWLDTDETAPTLGSEDEKYRMPARSISRRRKLRREFLRIDLLGLEFDVIRLERLAPLNVTKDFDCPGIRLRLIHVDTRIPLSFDTKG
jgi:hypothetical protein